MSAYYDDDRYWLGELEGFEPWEPDEDDGPEPAGGCAYCEATEVREHPDPFGGQPCCEACFNVLIGGAPDDPPWRCGTVIKDGER